MAKTKITLYVPEVKANLIHNAKELFKREETSISKWFIDNLERYVLVHAEGNPQLTILKFMEDMKVRECFFCRGHFDKLFKVEYKSGLVAPTCEVCLNKNKEKGVFSTVKKVRGLMK